MGRGGYNNIRLFCTVLEGGKSEVKVPADLQKAAFSLDPHMVERRSSGVTFSPPKRTDPIPGVPPSRCHLLITSQRPHLQRPAQLGVKTSIYRHLAVGDGAAQTFGPS